MAEQNKMTETVLEVLTQSALPLTQTEIESRVRKLRNDLSQHSVRDSLKRLKNTGYAVSDIDTRGVVTWAAKTLPDGADLITTETEEEEEAVDDDALLDQVDTAFEVIRAAVAMALETPKPPAITQKIETITALNLAEEVLRPTSPGAVARLAELRELIATFEEA